MDEGRDATSAPPRKRKRQSHVNEEQQTQDNEPIRSRQRRESGKGGIEYRHLTAVSRKIPRQTIDTKWGPLPTNAVDRVGVLLSDVEKLVVMRLQDERRRLQASTAIQMVSRRLQRKLTRGLPFPPGTRPQREEEFDFEKILDSNRELETRLTPMLHSIDLLKAEIEKEGNLLEQETARLEALEADARADTTRRKKDSKKLHFLLPADQGYVKLEEGWTVRLGDTDLGPQLMNVSGNLRPSLPNSDKDRLLTTKKTWPRLLTNYIITWIACKAI